MSDLQTCGGVILEDGRVLGWWRGGLDCRGDCSTGGRGCLLDIQDMVSKGIGDKTG